MDINHLISQYGYAALIVGSMAEGETITLLGGVAAHQGLLKAPLSGRSPLRGTHPAPFRQSESADP